MNNFPTGVVTFLFTDIDGSMKLAQEFPDTLPAVLERHNTILQAAVESNNGFIFEIVGDAYCYAFENAEDAVKASIDAQVNLSNEKWNDAVIKIRIGIPSGNAPTLKAALYSIIPVAARQELSIVNVQL